MDQYVYADLAQYWVDLLDNMNWTPRLPQLPERARLGGGTRDLRIRPNPDITLAGYAEALDAIQQPHQEPSDVPILVGPESESMNEFLIRPCPLRTRPHLGIYAYHNYNIGSQAGIDGEIPKFNQIRNESTNATTDAQTGCRSTRRVNSTGWIPPM